MSIACMGGWCVDRERCAHFHNTAGVTVVERLCEADDSDAFAPVRIVTLVGAWERRSVSAVAPRQADWINPLEAA